MSAYGEFKKRNIVYATYLFASESGGLVDSDESLNFLNALEEFDILEKEAIDDVFDEHDYLVALIKEFFDEKGRFVEGECLKKVQIKKEDAR